MKMYTAVHEMFRWSSTQIIRPILVKYFWSRSRHAEIRIAQFSYIEKKAMPGPDSGIIQVFAL